MKNIKSCSRLQKVCMIIFVLAFLILISGGIMLFMNDGKRNSNRSKSSDALADKMIYYPDYLKLGRPIDFTVYDDSGRKKKLSDYRGKNVIILYWSSWCRYCKQEFTQIAKYQQLLSQNKDVELILINKLDGKKETLEQAKEFLQKNGEGIQSYYDVDLNIFHQLGMKVIPDFIGIDKNGFLKLCYPDNLKGTDQLAAMIDYIRYGGSYASEKFVTEKLTGKDGQVHTNYTENGQAPPSGDDVLCESQSLVMEYAVLKNNKELFDRCLSYVTANMMNDDALAAWLITDTSTANPEKSRTNSLIDDLRIYDALFKANQIWGEYGDMLEKWQKAILTYNTMGDHLIDFYQFDKKEKADRLTLCFADISALEEMKDTENISELLEDTGRILEDGYISDDFPLYYSSYDYGIGKYSEEELNMAEEMVTLFNLAKIGKLKKETIAWLKNSMSEGGIKARYTPKGEVVKNYNYASTAVYALLVMLAKEIGDDELMTQALARMELMRIFDRSSEFDGSFGKGDGSDIYSYDQCMALLAYAYEEEK